MARTWLPEAGSLCSELPEGTALPVALPVAASQPGTPGQRHIPEQIPAQDSRAVSYISVCRTVSTWTHVLELHVPLQGCVFFCLILLPFRADFYLHVWLFEGGKHAHSQMFMGAFHLQCKQLCKDSVEHQEKKGISAQLFSSEGGLMWEWRSQNCLSHSMEFFTSMGV